MENGIMVIWLSIQLHCLKGEQIKRGSGLLISHLNVMEHEPTQQHSVHEGLPQCTEAHYSNTWESIHNWFSSRDTTCSIPPLETERYHQWFYFLNTVEWTMLFLNEWVSTSSFSLILLYIEPLYACCSGRIQHRTAFDSREYVYLCTQSVPIQ